MDVNVKIIIVSILIGLLLGAVAIFHSRLSKKEAKSKNKIKKAEKEIEKAYGKMEDAKKKRDKHAKELHKKTGGDSATSTISYIFNRNKPR